MYRYTQSPTLDAIAVARGLLDVADGDADALRGTVVALADATDWQARATAGYCAGIAALAGDVRMLAGRIASALLDLAIAERLEVARAGAEG
ncbi:MAG: hypothetical protein DI566_10125 [Microbacterium sp.]|nr:MAG: hypothetical protein DI566_10125 [Microbacterium sp.]